MQAEIFSKILSNLNSKKNEAVLEELKQVLSLLERNLNLKKSLSTPVTTASEKLRIFSKIFKEKMDPSLFSFLEILIKKGKLNSLPFVIQQFDHHFKKAQGISLIEIISAKPLAIAEKEMLVQSFAEMFGKNIEIDQRVDPSLIGGIICLFPDNKILDLSLKSKLDNFQRALAGDL